MTLSIRSNVQHPPAIITFDVLGTLVDWKRGLSVLCEQVGRPITDTEFDGVVDAQGVLESGRDFLSYADITQRSLVEKLNLDSKASARIASRVGLWPWFPDAEPALRSLMRTTFCAAMTNSDVSHGVQAQEELGFGLHDWLCAQDARTYKPNPRFWEVMARRRGRSFGPSWWHVSAYADYDLATAKRLGLTTVLVRRPHCRPGDSTYEVSDLHELTALLRS